MLDICIQIHTGNAIARKQNKKHHHGRQHRCRYRRSPGTLYLGHAILRLPLVKITVGLNVDAMQNRSITTEPRHDTDTPRFLIHFAGAQPFRSSRLNPTLMERDSKTLSSVFSAFESMNTLESTTRSWSLSRHACHTPTKPNAIHFGSRLVSSR